MIYHVILYEFPSGKTILNIHINPGVIKDEKIDLMCGFFTALTHFSLEMFENNTEVLNSIQFLNHSIRFVPIREIQCNMLIVFDEHEKLRINDFTHKITNLILQYKELFTEQRKTSNVSVITPLIDPVLSCILTINNFLRTNSNGF